VIDDRTSISCELLRENRISGAKTLIIRYGSVNNQHEVNNKIYIDVINILQEVGLLCRLTVFIARSDHCGLCEDILIEQQVFKTMCMKREQTTNMTHNLMDCFSLPVTGGSCLRIS
jgi:hypothetical protein